MKEWLVTLVLVLSMVLIGCAGSLVENTKKYPGFFGNMTGYEQYMAVYKYKSKTQLGEKVFGGIVGAFSESPVIFLKAGKYVFVSVKADDSGEQPVYFIENIPVPGFDSWECWVKPKNERIVYVGKDIKSGAESVEGVSGTG